jgi:hypothetical protein
MQISIHSGPLQSGNESLAIGLRRITTLISSPTLLDIFTESKQKVIQEVSRLNPPARETESQIHSENGSNIFLQHAIITNTIGLSVVVETFREAYYFIQHASSVTRKVREKAEECRDAFIFIQGTGLEMVLHRYGCEYDAENLRNVFFYMADRRDLIQ